MKHLCAQTCCWMLLSGSLVNVFNHRWVALCFLYLVFMFLGLCPSVCAFLSGLEVDNVAPDQISACTGGVFVLECEGTAESMCCPLQIRKVTRPWARLGHSVCLSEFLCLQGGTEWEWVRGLEWGRERRAIVVARMGCLINPGSVILLSVCGSLCRNRKLWPLEHPNLHRMVRSGL